MNKRQEKIFGAIVKEYTESAVAVGSKILVEKYGFEISPATIRNDMVELEKEGYLYQPHISAGRIPTDKGYKYFVEKIMGGSGAKPQGSKKITSRTSETQGSKQQAFQDYS